MRQRILFFLSSSLFLATGCGTEKTEPLTAATVRTSLHQTAQQHGHDGARMISDFVQGGFLDDAIDRVCDVTEGEEGCSSPELEFEEADVDDALTDIIDTFLADDRVVTETPDEVVYRVLATDLCDDEDSECLDSVTTLDIRLVARRDSNDGLEVTVRVANRDVWVLAIGADRISLEIDLAEAAAAAAAHPEIFGLEPGDIPSAVGKIEIALMRVNARHYTAHLSITEDVAIQHTATGESYGLSAAASTLIALDADADAESLIATIDVPQISAAMPGFVLDFLFEQSLGEETANIELGGLTGSFDLANLENELVISAFGLGDTTSTFSYAGEELLSVDLNANDGRTVDVAIQAMDGRLDFTFGPLVDIAEHFHLQPLADAGHEIPAWMFDSDNGVRFTADQGLPALRVTDERVRVENGTLELSSSELDAPVVIESGLCIEDDNTVDEDDLHPFAGLFGAICQ